MKELKITVEDVVIENIAPRLFQYTFVKITNYGKFKSSFGGFGTRKSAVKACIETLEEIKPIGYRKLINKLVKELQ